MLGRIQAKRGFSEQVWFVPKTVGGSGVTQHHSYSAHLKLETVFPAHKLAQNCYTNLKIFFS